MSCLFGGNSCTWVLILVIIFLLCQNDNDYSRCGNARTCGGCGGCGNCGDEYNTCGNSCGNNCGCGC